VRLAANDQQLALAHAASYRAVQRQRGELAAMIWYLRERQFLEFEGAPPIDREGFFVITANREEWAAWLDHYSGRFSEAVLATSTKRGFLLTRTRWPGGVADVCVPQIATVNTRVVASAVAPSSATPIRSGTTKLPY
jgi:hypothetical protein